MGHPRVKTAISVRIDGGIREAECIPILYIALGPTPDHYHEVVPRRRAQQNTSNDVCELESLALVDIEDARQKKYRDNRLRWDERASGWHMYVQKKASLP